MPSIQCRLWRIQNPSDLALPHTTHPNTDLPTPGFHRSSDYPFPPPGLSKPSAMSYSPLDLDLSPHRLATPSPPPPADSSDSSIWGAFQLDSFIANYCHNVKPVASPSFHNSHNGDPSHNSHLLPSSNVQVSVPPSICPTYLKRLKSLISLETGNTIPTHPVSRRPPPPNPLMTRRLRQQAFMLKWNKFREKNPYAPAMPSYFNPSRSEAPQCAWTFLRDPACGGFVNERISARRGNDSIFERPLVKLPLTRCRSICDGTRRVQHYDGWGIHAWFSPSKHCGPCANDTLLKNFLAFRAFEVARIQEAQQMRERFAMMNPSPSSGDLQEEAPDPDAVLLSFPYQRSADGYQPMDSFVNYNDLDSCSNLSDDFEDWNEDVDKEFLAIQDLDDCDLDSLEDDDGLWHSDEEDDDDRYSDSSSSDTCENEEISVSVCPTTVSTSSESRFEGDEKKAENLSGGIVLMTLHSDDGDNDEIEVVEAQSEEAEDWTRVVEVQVQA